MAATVHYLDEYFNMANWTLEFEHIPGSHTGELIATCVGAVVSRWGLWKGNCTVLLRDGASNAVLAVNILGVYRILCIPHVLHLVAAVPLTTIVDCSARWSSSLDMLARLIQLKSAFENFFEYLATTDGKKEFPQLRLACPKPTNWLTIDWLMERVVPFALATRKFSGDTYPTLSLAYLFLRSVRNEMEKPNLLDGKVGLVIEQLQELCGQA
ncbi:Zinc finger BED domain containing hypothetical protein 4-like [Phytophthora palmivora]|uniref:Uncharacterized protein n=1 Tax=Phytophthora palmivora TaxID=4796 RepID=A0A2P4XGT3_9STRA|nr:Zinc finger BED domain containing hypothetical protein 4-like [Phytophthora palmivora]